MAYLTIDEAKQINQVYERLAVLMAELRSLGDMRLPGRVYANRDERMLASFMPQMGEHMRVIVDAWQAGTKRVHQLAVPCIDHQVIISWQARDAIPTRVICEYHARATVTAGWPDDADPTGPADDAPEDTIEEVAESD